jgi:CHASE2 domain-containing sensor protein
MTGRFRRYQWRLLPGTIVLLVIALVLQLSLFQPLEQIAYRTLFQWRGSLAWDDRLVLVVIDDASLGQLGRFPWPRRTYRDLLTILRQANAAIVAVDLLLSEPSPEDGQLAQAINQQGRVVLAEGWDGMGFPLKPVPLLEQAAIATGHVLKREDSDGIVRQVDLAIQDRPALGVATVEAYGLVQHLIPLPDLKQPLQINWVGPVRQLRQYSFADVIQGKVPRAAWNNKIVLVGVTATGFDSMITPFDQNPMASSVYLHAAVINNLLQQNYLRVPNRGWMVLILLLGGPGLSWVLSDLRPRYYCMMLAGAIAVWMVLSAVLLRVNVLIPVVFPLALFGFTGGAVALSQRVQENYLIRHQIQRLWRRYHQDLVFNANRSCLRCNQPCYPPLLWKLPASLS